jgi:hypothetical protein
LSCSSRPPAPTRRRPRPTTAPSASSSSDTHASIRSKKWKCACVNYEPKNPDLVFQAVYCLPGDARGGAPETTAEVFCRFTDGTNET